MSDAIRIQMMGNFLIFVNETRIENPVSKSRMGAAFMELLILNGGRPMANQRLIRALWPANRAINPESALKTLVSRMRTLLNQISPNLGACIVSERGAYRWRSAAGMRIDVLEIEDIFTRLDAEDDADTRRALYRRLMSLYEGDLFQPGKFEDETAYAEGLHSRYLKAVYDYIDLLRHAEEYNEISAVCRVALEVDNFDDRLHIELMRAMVNVNRVSDAMAQYKYATDATQRYLGAAPSREMQAFYREMNRARQTLKFNLDAIRNALQNGAQARGAFVCEFTMFKEIYSLQMRNLERLGTTMFLGIIMIGDTDDASIDNIRRENIMGGLIAILRNHLRKGDIITHFSPTVVALLLPTVNYDTGTMVLERVRQLFYREYPASNIPFHYRLGILGGAQNEAANLAREDEEEQ